MTSPLPPVAPAANGAALPASLPVAGTPAAAGAAAPSPAAPASAAPASAAPAVATPPAATAVRWSAEMLQNLRLQAFEQLVAQLARQVQASPNAPAPQWPASGVSEALGRMLQMLLEQMGAQQGRPPLQMLAAQPGSAALLQALAAAAANPPTPTAAAAPVPAASGTPAPAPAPGPVPLSTPVLTPPPAASAAPALASLAAAVARASVPDALLAAGTAPVPPGAAAAAAPAPASQALPPLQNWWVQQGTLVTPQGERGFMLSLQVPQAWAQAQLAATALSGAAAPAAQQAAAAQAPQAVPSGGPLAAALMAAPPAAGGQAPGAWRLALDVPLQALASGPVALVLQPRDEPQLRTSALLLLELQPLRQAQAPSVLPGLPFTALPPAMAQEMQQLLQNRGDPWLQMAVAQNAGAVPERRGHQSHLCTTAGCQYEGRAPCAQPFCSEMNRLWGVARAERRL